MTDKKEKAIQYFKKGMNCAQAVLCSFAPDFNLDEETAARVSCGFGGGMARLQNTCGAVTGAIMVLGLKYGKHPEGYARAKTLTYKEVRRFVDEFKKRHHVLDCRDLLGLDLNDEEQHKQFKEKNLSVIVCDSCVRDAVIILEEIMA
jgi:C_GCAxxG_C_C family probable redox protein